MEAASAAAGEGKTRLVMQLPDGMDPNALREAATSAVKSANISIMLFSPDPVKARVMVFAAVPSDGTPDVLAWLKAALAPLEGKGGGGKGGVAQGQGGKLDALREASKVAEDFTS